MGTDENIELVQLNNFQHINPESLVNRLVEIDSSTKVKLDVELEKEATIETIIVKGEARHDGVDGQHSIVEKPIKPLKDSSNIKSSSDTNHQETSSSLICEENVSMRKLRKRYCKKYRNEVKKNIKQKTNQESSGRTKQDVRQECILCNTTVKHIRVHLRQSHRLSLHDKKRQFILSFYQTKKVNIA